LLYRLTKELLDTQGIPLQQAIAVLRQYLPKQAILVGQNIAKDVEWLGLQEGRDFQQLMDLTGLYRIWNPKYSSYSVFGQDHLAKVLLNWDTSDAHDAVG
jgi:RNA exonuclease 4